MPHRTHASQGGVGAGEDIAGSSLTSGDRNRIDEDRRSQSINVQLAPDMVRTGVVYTIQEILTVVNQKLDEHGKQLALIWSKLLLMERELDEMKERGNKARDEEERHQQNTLLLVFRFATVVLLVVIIVLLWWLITQVTPG